VRHRPAKALALALAVAALAPAAASADHGLLVGVDDDSPKWGQHAPADVEAARDLGLQAFRITLAWAPGQSQLTPADAAIVARAVAAARGFRLVVAVYGSAASAPRDDASRTAYASFVADLLRRFPTIGDVVVWNEPNTSRFWQPQYNPDRTSAAPVAYEALLARTWDAAHAVRPQVNVIAASASFGNDFPEGASVAHSPAVWYRQLGLALRLSRRTSPIFDTVGHNPYPDANDEAPWTAHPSSPSVGEGDYGKLVQALRTGFAGTAQPVPGTGLQIWYLEQGFQTTIDPAKSAFYSGRETEPRLVAPLDPTGRSRDQAAQLRDAIRLAYCQPYVKAFFNFELADESDLGGWQSGVLWADWTRKPSYDALKAAIAEVRSGAVACASVLRQSRSARP